MRCFIMLLFVFLFSCQEHEIKKSNTKRKICFQAFEGMPDQEVRQLRQDLTAFFQPSMEINLLPIIPFPKQAYYAPRYRYRADSLIRFLQQHIPIRQEVIIGLSPKDISTTKGEYLDFGVMGLGFQPGKSCVVSTYRLAKENRRQQLFKVTIHEFGHTQGLPHCAVDTCYMRDAKGGNPLNQERNFCAHCKKYLQSKGWQLP